VVDKPAEADEHGTTPVIAAGIFVSPVTQPARISTVGPSI
jgi:hypothetical protein